MNDGRAAQGSPMDMLRQVKPTTFYGVPWVWDRLPDDLKASQLALTPFGRLTSVPWGWGSGSTRVGCPEEAGAQVPTEVPAWPGNGSPERWQVDLRVAPLARRRQWG